MAKVFKRKDFWFGFIISSFCIWWIIGQINFVELSEQIRSAKMHFIVLAFFICNLSYLIRAFRWNFFFKEKTFRFKDAYKCLVVGFFMNNTLPARMGELVRARAGALVSRQSLTTVLATIVSERLLDALTICFYFVVLFGLFARKDSVADNEAIYYVVYFFLAIALFTITTLLLRYKIFGLLKKINQKFSHHFITFALERIRDFIEGLAPLFNIKNAIIFIFLSIMVWGVELCTYYAVQLAFDVHLGLSGLVLFMVVVNFSSLIPAAPGGIGVIEAATVAILVKIGVDPTTALALILTQHVIQIIVVGIPGSCFFFSVMKKNIIVERC